MSERKNNKNKHLVTFFKRNKKCAHLVSIEIKMVDGEMGICYLKWMLWNIWKKRCDDKQDEDGKDCECEIGRKICACSILISTKGDEQSGCYKEGMSEWEDEWLGTRKKRWADEHKCMKRWVDECDKIKWQPQESLIQSEINQNYT